MVAETKERLKVLLITNLLTSPFASYLSYITSNPLYIFLWLLFFVGIFSIDIIINKRD